MTTSTRRKNPQQAVILTLEQLDVLETVATEQGLLGGPGKAPGRPNIAAAMRYLMAKSDSRMAAAPDVELTWDRSGK